MLPTINLRSPFYTSPSPEPNQYSLLQRTDEIDDEVSRVASDQGKSSFSALPSNANSVASSHDRHSYRRVPVPYLDSFVARGNAPFLPASESPPLRHHQKDSRMYTHSVTPTRNAETVPSHGSRGFRVNSLDFGSQPIPETGRSMVSSNDQAGLYSGAKHNSHLIQFQVRLAEVANMISKKAKNDAPDYGLVQQSLILLEEYYRHGGPLESSLLKIHSYIISAIFSQSRCIARSCVDPCSAYFQHIHHLENEIDYRDELLKKSEERFHTRDDEIEALHREIAKLKAQSSAKDEEIIEQRKKFEIELERDSEKTMGLYADVEAAESECEAYRLRVVKLLDILSKVTVQVKELGMEKHLTSSLDDQTRFDFTDHWDCLRDIQSRIVDSVPKSVLREAQVDLSEKKEALSVLKSKYFTLQTANNKLKAMYNEALDKIAALENDMESLHKTMTPRPDFKQYEDVIGGIENLESTKETIELIVDQLATMKTEEEKKDFEHSDSGLDSSKHVSITPSPNVSSTEISENMKIPRRRMSIDPFSSHQVNPSLSSLKKYHANMGESKAVPIYLRSPFSAPRSEYRPIGKNTLETIIKDIFSKRHDELASLYGNIGGENKYTAGSLHLKSRVSFEDFFHNYLQTRYHASALEWGYNIHTSAEFYRSEPLFLVFQKSLNGAICEDAYFEIHDLVHNLRDSLMILEKSQNPKGLHTKSLVLEDIIFSVCQVFPSKSEDDLHVIRHMLDTEYNEGNIQCDELFDNTSGKMSPFVEILYDQFVLEMEEFLRNIEQELEASSSDFGVTTSQAIAVIQKLDPDSPHNLIQNYVAVGFEVFLGDLDTFPISSISVSLFMKRLKQIMIRRYSKVHRHRRAG